MSPSSAVYLQRKSGCASVNDNVAYQSTCSEKNEVKFIVLQALVIANFVRKQVKAKKMN